ncbi:MAG TPA: hypothetical protein VL049_15895 [Candidatus Dormibacteraeota bacterium]|nr:hypothetical protein [Candidatus Dormibacteraeota bacterium]
MSTGIRRALLAAMLMAAVVATPHCASARNTTAAMWLSIAHPGLGEWYLKGWGNFGDRCPQNKFWLGFIPIYGWPGYLQVKSAIDAKHGRTNDNLTN